MWYEILVREPYFSFICSDEFDADSPLFKEFCDIIIAGITIGNIITKIDAEKRMLAVDTLKGSAYYPICAEFLDRCNFRDVKLGEHIKSGRENYINGEYEKMSDEQIAAWIIYPFLSRMGGSFEKEFAASGELKKLMLILSERIKSHKPLI